MKKLIFSFVALLMIGSGVAHATQGEGATGANKKREIPGALGYVPYKEIQLVRWGESSPANSTTLSAGDVVVRDTLSDDGVTIGLIGTINCSTDAVAGVIVSPTISTAESTGLTPGVDYGRRNWGWMQVKGYCPTVNITAGAGPGSALYASSTNRYATKSADNAPFNQRVLGFAYDNASQGQAEAELDV